MTEFLEAVSGKFTFQVATDRHYSKEGLWVKQEGGLLRLGLSDYVQQRNGDLAFVELKPAGKHLAAGEELANIETIKVNSTLITPVTGSIVRVNPQIEATPEIINQDPYSNGWLVDIQPELWPAEQAQLLDAAAYLAQIQKEIEDESR